MSFEEEEGVTWDSPVDALVALGAAADLGNRAASSRLPDAQGAFGGADPTPVLEHVAATRGFEVEASDCAYADLPSTLARAAPAVVRLPSGRFVALVASNPRRTTLLGPSSVRTVGTESLVTALRAGLERDGDGRVDHWLACASITGRRARSARAHLRLHLLGERAIGGIWLLRSDAGTSALRELRRRGLVGRTAGFVGASLLQVLVGIAGWTLLGRAALSGSLGAGWLGTWVLLLFTGLALSIAQARIGQRITQDVATFLKERLLRGALRMAPDEIRKRGSGHLLATVSESSAIESAGLSGALGAVMALVQLTSAGALLAMGAGGAVHVLMLVAFTVVVVALGVRAHRRRSEWTSRRLDLTSTFIEHVLGHRTRRAQQPEAQWHEEEDGAMMRYLGASRTMESTQATFAGVPARGWLLLALVGLIPRLVAGPVDPRSLALAIGGILAAQGALATLASSGGALFGAWVGWRSIGALFHSASRIPAPGLVPDHDELRRSGEVVLEAQGVGFRHRPGGRPTLEDCSLTVRRGDRVLLEGPSGGGKSTFASVLTGMHDPESGHVLLGGLDLPTRGRVGWRRRIASAPQFHENHVLSGSLAFNLLMGRSWPASDADRAEAKEVCCELGLGGLLNRMPGGLDQVVGETGWQLSHGERSRLFLARALLQKADVVVLDETFGALDPLTLEQCLGTLERRAASAIVIAHP